MICVVIPTLNCAEHLSMLLPQLKGADRIVVADGGSEDKTLDVAAKSAVIAAGAKGRGAQLALGASHSGDADWLLFIHADNVLPHAWMGAVEQHIASHPNAVGYFRYKANAKGFWPRFMDFWVGMRCQWWGQPYGDQGVLISKDMYDAVGGYPTIALFEDVAIIDAVKEKYGRTAIRPLNAHMHIDISKYTDQGIWTRGLRNLKLVKAYRRGEDIGTLAKAYQET